MMNIVLTRCFMKIKILGFLVLGVVLSRPGYCAPRNSNTAFMQGKYGIFCDYLYGYQCLPITHKGMTEWNSYVNSFNAAEFANNCAAEGASYVVFTVWQGMGMICAPSTTYDGIMTKAGYWARSPNRDLISDIYTALNAKGIKLMLYVVEDPGWRNLQLRQALNESTDMSWLDGNKMPLTKNLFFNIIAIAKEWSLRYGNIISGWMVDGGFNCPGNYAALFLAACRSGNPDAVINFFGPGPEEDIRFEDSYPALPKSKWNSEGLLNAPNMILGPMKGVEGSDGWGNPGIRLKDSQVIDYVKGCMDVGASCLVDQCIYPDGGFDPKQYGQMVAVKAAVYGGAPAPIPAPR
jgi:hypothetical protein